MRTILFRGKRIDNDKWVEGSLILLKKRFGTGYYINPISTIYASFGVIPETVGQFTGLTDKNGVNIFEGNIVRVLYTDWISKSESDNRTMDQYLIDIASIGIIKFDFDRYCVSTVNKKYNEEHFENIQPGKYGYIEIIGNIHDNKDLLK